MAQPDQIGVDDLRAIDLVPIDESGVALVQRDEREDPDAPWCRYMADRAGNFIQVENVPPFGELSEYETDVLNGVIDSYGRMSASALRRIHHALPEWTDPEGSSEGVDPTVILRAVGWPEDEIRQVTNEAETHRYLVSSTRQS